MHEDFHPAPLDTRAKVLTLAVAGLLMALAREEPLGLVVLVLLILLGTAVLGIRGYRLTEEEFQIRHFGWSQRWRLRDLRDVSVQPGVLAGSIRTFGIGGFFGYFGRFRGRLLGSYKAYVTDGSRAVVLRFFDDTIVISPEDPASFVSKTFHFRTS
jgi:Bacterial PH domain